MSLTRRSLIAAAAAAPLVSANAVLPTRKLGKTGARVSILAIGGGSRFLMYKEEDKALEALNKALDLGIAYVDTAYGYGNGVSEERVGKGLKGRRKQVFLATKINKRDPDEAQAILETSMKRLQTDQVDLIHIHSLTTAEDLKEIEKKGGVLDVLRKLRDQKVTRFIGITSHTDPHVLATALERNDFDCTQMALNGALVGMKDGPKGMLINAQMKPSFESVALPVAKKKNLGVIAMKVYGQDGLVGAAPLEKLLQYSLSLPVAAAVVGMPKLEYIEQNVGWARAFKPMPASEMRTMSGDLSVKHKAKLDYFFADHIDA